MRMRDIDPEEHLIEMEPREVSHSKAKSAHTTKKREREIDRSDYMK